MNNLLIPLMQEYQRLLEIEDEFDNWQVQNPDKSEWQYKGQRVTKARFERFGVMISQTMIDYERNHKPYY